MDTLEKRYELGKISKHYFTVSSQHYPFASEAFAEVAESVQDGLYELMYIETETSPDCKKSLTLADLAPYPFLTYSQSHNNTYSMSEIILEPFHIDKHLIVSDRASATSLMLRSDAYCITAGAYPGTDRDGSWTYIPIHSQGELIVGQIRNEHMIISKLERV